MQDNKIFQVIERSVAKTQFVSVFFVTARYQKMSVCFLCLPIMIKWILAEEGSCRSPRSSVVINNYRSGLENGMEKEKETGHCLRPCGRKAPWELKVRGRHIPHSSPSLPSPHTTQQRKQGQNCGTMSFLA